jgi:hypothetical protein
MADSNGFLDSVSGILGSVFNMDNLASGVKIAGLSVLLNYLQPDEKPKDKKGVREQVDPDTTHHIPILYGTAYTAGIVSDAQMAGDAMTMYYCLTFCEQTGPLMSTGAPSIITVEKVYWNENRINFKSNGVTAASFEDASGTVSTTIDGLIDFYFYSGNSANQVFPFGLSGTTAAAYTRMQGWTPNHMMNDLVFCIVKVKYDKEKSVTGLGNVKVQLKNTLKLPGDVMNDYMTNTRYGAGIKEQDIKQV